MENNKHEANFTMVDWYKKVMFENYANFSGRARRAEYWNFVLMNVIVSFTLYVLVIVGAAADLPFLAGIGGVLLVLYVLATFIPGLAVAIRRLHDTNKSGAYFLLAFVPVVSLILIVFYATEGDRQENQYGADPKNYMAMA